MSVHPSSQLLTGGVSALSHASEITTHFSAPQYTGNSQFYREGQLKTHVQPPHPLWNRIKETDIQHEVEKQKS